MKNHNSKNYKKIIIMVIIILALILILSFFAYSLIKDTYDNALKKEVFEGLSNSDISFFLDNKYYNSLQEKLNNKNYEIISDIKISTTMKNNMFSDLDLSRFSFNYDLKKNNKENISYHKINTKYGGNNLLIIDAINEKNEFAIKSDEIVNRYVGIEKKNFQEISNKIFEEKKDFSNARKLKKFVFERENINLENISTADVWEKYIDIIKTNVTAENISKKENIIVTLENEQIPAIEYTISFSTEQLNSILRKISNEFENDDELISEFVIGDSAKSEKNNRNNIIKNKNSTTVEIKAKENNYNATVNIWGENEDNIQEQINSQNTILPQEPQISNTISDNTTAVNQVESNTVSNETINNNSQNNSVNHVVSTNEISNTINNVDNNTVTDNTARETSQEEIRPQPADQQTQQENVDNNEENRIENDNTIPQEDNFRLQGFISINENTEYVGDDDFVIGENYDETIKNISKLAKNINWTTYILTGAKANYTTTQMKDLLINNLNESIKKSNTLIAKVYISENKAVKLSIEIPETHENFDIEISSKGNNEKYLNIKKLKGEENDINGNAISIYKKSSDNSNKMKININKVQSSKISNKIAINMDTTGNINSQKYTNSFNISRNDSNGEFKISTSNKIEFKDKLEIDELSDDNCLFIDKLSDEELLATRDAIIEKINLVMRQKNQDLEIIDTANSNTVILSDNEEDN